MKNIKLLSLVMILFLLQVNCAKKITDEDMSVINKKAEEQYVLGQSYHREKRYVKARRKFRKVIKKYPQSDYADKSAFEIAEIFHEAKSYWRAYEKYQVVANDFPASDFIPQVSEEEVNIGDHYWNKGKKYEAVEIYRTALDTYSFGDRAPEIQYKVAGYYFEYADNYRGLFRSIYKEENFGLSILEYKKALDNYPSHTLSVLAKYRLGLANYYLSLPWYNDQTTSNEAIIVFQELLGEKGAEDFQEDIRKKIDILSNRREESECRIGDFYLKQNKLKSARIYYQNVIKRDYSDLWTGKAYFGMGESYCKEKKWSEAREYYKKVLSEYPESAKEKILKKRLAKTNKKINE